ncbi:MAG: DEAD/DEAH box helicase [Pyrinomonadaceae bacterium]
MPSRRNDKPKREKRRDSKPKNRNPSGARYAGERPARRELAERIAGKTAPTDTQKRILNRLLSGIGTPAPQPFVPDAFQLEAIEAIETEDVLVTAPTGSGKTWIAREEIRRLLEQGKRAWYTTPLKALTNSKYQEFGAEFGFENVGILTGDRKENYAAPLIVGTTEIYRNQLFDALRSGEQVNTDLVILDEAHYLADEDRGHVWEEAIILSPPRIRLLLLSATIGNAGEFADWIAEVRGVSVRVINRAGTRPVELRAAFLSPDLQLIPLYDETGKMNREIERFAQQDNRFDRWRHYKK